MEPKRIPQAEVMVVGAGLAGLAAASRLCSAGRSAVVLEKSPWVGGLARTVERDGFRFDLGGHRLISDDESIQALILDLLAGDALEVNRSSQVLLDGKYYDYPWRLSNALSGLGSARALAMVVDCAVGRLWRSVPAGASFQEVMVHRFGRTMFNRFVRDYTEKVWGLPSQHLTGELAQWRIQNLSLAVALRDALRPALWGQPRTLARRFVYPALGIGQLAERLCDRIHGESAILTGTGVRAIHHARGRITGVTVEGGAGAPHPLTGMISTLPLGRLVQMLRPSPPPSVAQAASRLRFRDLVVVAILIDKPRVTGHTWIYLPSPHLPFGRIHEPTNWSPRMAPPGKTLLVAEYFCFRGDATWNAGEEQLIALTQNHLTTLGFLKGPEVLGGVVVRVPSAYPIFDLESAAHCRTIQAYLQGFANLWLAGRGGEFRYYNMDHALASGLEAAEKYLATQGTRQAVPPPPAMAEASQEVTL